MFFLGKLGKALDKCLSVLLVDAFIWYGDAEDSVAIAKFLSAFFLLMR